MSRKKAAEPTLPATTPDDISGTFYTVGKESHLLYSAWQIEIENGVVVSVKGLSRAPDLAASAVGACTRELWRTLRQQKALHAV